MTRIPGFYRHHKPLEGAPFPLRPLCNLFDSEANADILEDVLFLLDSKAVLVCARINTHMNRIITQSSRLQLSLRLDYNAVSTPSPSTSLSHAEQLDKLIQLEKNLTALDPKRIRHAEFPLGKIIDVQDGLMLVGEAFRTPGFEFEVETHGWDVWQIRQSSEETFGGKRIMGMKVWSDDVGQTIHGLAMCPEDNVIAIATSPPHTDNDDDEYTTRRLHFRRLRPLSQEDLGEGIDRKHQLAALPFIEFVMPTSRMEFRNAYESDIQIIPGGSVGIFFSACARGPDVMIVFDWQRGLCLGRFTMTCQDHAVHSFRFLTSDLIALSTIRNCNKSPATGKDVDIRACLGVFVIPRDLAQPPHRTSTLAPESEEDQGIACTWDVKDMLYGVPTVMLCLPRINDPHTGAETTFLWDQTRISLTFRDYGSQAAASDILDLHLSGYWDLSAGTCQPITCSMAISIKHILRRVAMVIEDRIGHTSPRTPSDQYKRIASSSTRDRSPEDGAPIGRCDYMVRFLWNDNRAKGSRRPHDSKHCTNLVCRCHKSCLEECARAKQDGQPEDIPHYHFHIIPWAAWGTPERLSLQDPFHYSATVVSREITIVTADTNHRWKRPPSSRYTDTDLHIFVRDYNPDVSSGPRLSFDRPIGSTDDISTPEESERPVLDYVLARPGLPPQFLEPAITTKLYMDDFERYLHKVFLDVIPPAMFHPAWMPRHRRISRRMQVESIETVKGVFWDGASLVVAMVCDYLLVCAGADVL